jgi:hypothetical protein
MTRWVRPRKVLTRPKLDRFGARAQRAARQVEREAIERQDLRQDLIHFGPVANIRRYRPKI